MQLNIINLSFFLILTSIVSVANYQQVYALPISVSEIRKFGYRKADVEFVLPKQKRYKLISNRIHKRGNRVYLSDISKPLIIFRK